MDLRKLKTFKVVAECLNLTKAADKLGYTQPTITLQLQSLENDLGTVLLRRVGKKTYLTASGEIVKSYVDRLFGMLEEMDDELKNMRSYGLLKIAAPELYCNYFLPAAIHAFINDNPHVKLQLYSCDSQETLQRIESNDADIGIIAGSRSSRLVYKEALGREDYVLVTTRELHQAHSLEELMTKYPLITYRKGPTFIQAMEEFKELFPYRLDNIIECISDETIKRTLLKQTGVALMGSIHIERDMKRGALVELHRFPGRIETSLIVLKTRFEEQHIQSFSAIIKKVWSQTSARYF